MPASLRGLLRRCALPRWLPSLEPWLQADPLLRQVPFTILGYAVAPSSREARCVFFLVNHEQQHEAGKQEKFCAPPPTSDRPSHRRSPRTPAAPRLRSLAPPPSSSRILAPPARGARSSPSPHDSPIALPQARPLPSTPQARIALSTYPEKDNPFPLASPCRCNAVASTDVPRSRVAGPRSLTNSSMGRENTRNHAATAMGILSVVDGISTS